VNLAFRVAGPIQKIYVKEGDFVKKDQLIAEMDTRDYIMQKQAVEAQVTQLRGEYERIAELNKRKSVADNDFEKMKAGKKMAEAQLKHANDQLNDTKLYASFSGYITKVMFKNGELVNHGTPIASLIDVSMLKIEINVPASMYINKNQIIKIECTQDEIKNTSFPLTLFANNIKANNNGLYKFSKCFKFPMSISMVIISRLSRFIKYPDTYKSY
jgi:RND family efflux transporter MFP subunit